MRKREGSADATDTIEALRSVLKTQYHAALAMLRAAIKRCPWAFRVPRKKPDRHSAGPGVLSMLVRSPQRRSRWDRH